MLNNLLENDILIDNGDLVKYRLLYIDLRQDKCILIKLNTDKLNISIHVFSDITQLILNDEWSIEFLEDTPFEDQLSKAQVNVLEERWQIILQIINKCPEPDIFNKRYRRKIIIDTARKNSVSDVYIYKILRLYLQGGKIKNALIPKYSNIGIDNQTSKKVGRKNHAIKNNLYPELGKEAEGITITGTHLENIRKTINRTLLSKNNLTITKAYERLLTDYYSVKDKSTGIKSAIPFYKIPTVRQFTYQLEKLQSENLIDYTIKKDGQRAFNLQKRQLLSDTLVDSHQPGFRFEIDATIPFIPLLDSTRTKPIGTATIYYVIDTFTKMIVGFYVGLDKASKKTASSALLSCIENKVEMARRYGVDISEDDWFVDALPKNLTADRGEFLGELGDRISSQLKFNVENTGSYRGDMKGNVEKAFDITEKDFLGILPSYQIKKWTDKKRGDIDEDKHAVLTIGDLRKIIIRKIVEHNNKEMPNYSATKEMISAGIVLSPNNIWRWSVENIGCDVVRVTDKMFAKYVLTMEMTASITQHGVKLKDFYYSSKESFVADWFVDARINGRTKIKVHVDERDMSTILIKLNNSSKITEFKQTDKSLRQYGNITLFEFNEYMNMKKTTKTLNIDTANTSRIQYNDDVDVFISQAVKETKRQRVDTNDSSKNKRANRKIENELDRVSQSVTFSDSDDYEEIGTAVNEAPQGKKALEEIRKEKFIALQNERKA